MARRELTAGERAIWAEYLRQVAPLPGRARPPAPPPAPGSPIPAPSRIAAVRPPASPITLPPPLIVDLQPPGIDTSTWQRFRTGRLHVARTLDLHGRTAQRAFHALEHFLHHAHADRARCVEVITGRGAGEAGGILRRELPLWLNLPALRPMVLAAAHPHPANPGAVRLLLRKPR